MTLFKSSKSLARFTMDTGFWRSRPYAGAGLAVAGIQAAAVSYCHEHGTDGHLPPVDVLGAALGFSQREVSKTADEMLRRQIWAPTQEGLEIVGYLDHNPSSAEVESVRSRKSAAAARTNHRRWHTETPDPLCSLCNESHQRVATPTEPASRGVVRSGEERSGQSPMAPLLTDRTDDDFEVTRQEALDLLGKRHLAARMTADVIARKGPVGDVVAWQAADRVKTLERHGERLKALTAGSAAELAELLEPAPRATTVTPPPFEPSEVPELPALEAVRPNLERSRAALLGRSK